MIFKSLKFASRYWLQPLERFLQIEAASGFILLAATVAALIWANSPAADSYEHLWHWQLLVPSVYSGPSLHFIVNDFLMAIFFLVVGLEIRREVHQGALATLKLATLPLAAAVGGIIFPALIYLAFNSQAPLNQGWAVPMATDIAFAVGVLALLGKRVPPALRVLLLALAVIDDIAAILVIAIFYSDGIAVAGLLMDAGGIAGVLLLHRWGVHPAWVYLLPGAAIWYGLLQAGLHPTLAGVILGLLTPVAMTERMESALHSWVAYGVMPVFALANAGVSFSGLDLSSASSFTLTAGIVLGLAVGKPLGIVMASALAVRAGWCSLPQGANWSGVWVVGCLGGIGFTMSIFIATLAFDDGALLAGAKFAVLMASTAAAIAGLIAGSLCLKGL